MTPVWSRCGLHWEDSVVWTGLRFYPHSTRTSEAAANSPKLGRSQGYHEVLGCAGCWGLYLHPPSPFPFLTPLPHVFL